MSYKFNPFTGNFDIAAAGSATTPGGSDTQVQFNDSGSFGGDSGLTFNKTTNALTVGGATVTADAPVLDLSQTWNNAGVTFTGLKFNVTDTASNASSLLMDLQVGGSSKFSVTKAGLVNTTNLAIAGYLSGATFVATNQLLLNVANQDVSLNRDAANTLAQRNSTNAQTFRLYRTYTSGTDLAYTALKQDATTGFILDSVNATAAEPTNLLDLQLNGSTKFVINKFGQIVSTSGVTFVYGGVNKVDSNTLGLGVSSGDYIAWSSDPNAGQTKDLILRRDAANTLAQRNSTNAQESRVYATYTSGTSYQRCGIKTAKTTLSNVSGASVTASSLIPAGAFLIGVTSRVNTALGTSNGTTGYQVGTASDPDLWGAITGTAEGTASGSANYTAPGASGLFTEATNVIVTAVGGNFDATGVIELAIHYLLTEAD